MSRLPEEIIEETISQLIDASRVAFLDIADEFQVKNNKDENLHRAEKYADALQPAIEDFIYGLAAEIRGEKYE